MLSNIIRFAKNIVVSLIAIFVCFGVLDFLWLGVIADGWYQSEMAPLLRSQFITWPWVVFTSCMDVWCLYLLWWRTEISRYFMQGSMARF